jgi:integral membrane protein
MSSQPPSASASPASASSGTAPTGSAPRTGAARPRRELKPKASDAKRIRNALKLYRVTSIVTGAFLLLLCLMMLTRYGFGVDIELNGPFGFLALTPKEQITGVNISTVILILHGWFYVVYLFSDFHLWSLMRWSFTRFIIIALGGVVPFLSFIVERHYHRLATKQIAAVTDQLNPVEATH